MRIRVLCLVLCVVAFVASMFMMLNLIDSTLHGTEEENPGTPDELENGDGAGEVMIELSRAGVAKLALDIQSFIDTLAYGTNKSYEEKARAYMEKLKSASEYVMGELQLAEGARYLYSLAEVLEPAFFLPYANNSAFSDRTSALLANLDSLYAQLPEDENRDLYPVFDTGVNGTFVLAMLSVYQRQNLLTNQQNGIVTISFGGNLLLGDALGVSDENSFYGEYVKSGNNPGYPLNAVSAIFANDNASFVNLEAPITGSTVPSDGTNAFRGIPEYVPMLTHGGIDQVSLANNHILDYGVDGYNDTIANLDANNIGYATDAGVKHIDSVAGRIAHISFNLVNTAKSQTDIINEIKNAVKAEKENGASIVILSVHWDTRKRTSSGGYAGETSLYESRLDANNKDIARAAIDSGADLVVGSHSHVIQGIESYKGKLIVYNLGDLSFSAPKSAEAASSYSLIFQQSFRVENGAASSVGYKVFPIVNTNDTVKYMPLPVFDETAKTIVDRLVKESSYFTNSIQSFDYIRITK